MSRYGRLSKGRSQCAIWLNMSELQADGKWYVVDCYTGWYGYDLPIGEVLVNGEIEVIEIMKEINVNIYVGEMFAKLRGLLYKNDK